jgi:hypothetical protein
MTVTRKTINEAYGNLLYAETLLGILSKADVELIGGEASVVFDVLSILLSKGSRVLDSLDCGYSIEPEEEKATTGA